MLFAEGAKPYQSAMARKAGIDARQGTTMAITDPDGGLMTSAQGKVDSETNTDLSILMMRRQQGYYQVAGAPGAGPYVTGQYGVRRPSAPLPGERYANYRGMVYPRPAGGGVKLGSPASVYMVPRKDGGQAVAASDMGPEAYSASTLEKKRRAQMASAHAHSVDYATNSLGRRRPGENIKEKLFGSRSSLNKMGNSENANVASTIISNPHATYGRQQQDASQTGYHAMPNGRQQYVNMYMTHSADGLPSRPLSAMSSPVGAPGWGRSNASMVANGMRSAMSETESVECLQSSIQAQIQQAKALAQASRNILAQNQHFTQSLQRSDSFRSTRSERHANGGGGVTSQAHTLPRTGSCTHMSVSNGEQQPTSPTPSHASSVFAYTTQSSQNGGGGVGYQLPLEDRQLARLVPVLNH